MWKTGIAAALLRPCRNLILQRPAGNNKSTALIPFEMATHHDSDAHKGAVEHDRGDSNTSLAGQLPHRTDNPLVKANDSDFPEPGGSPEHSGEPQAAGNQNLPQDKERTQPRVPNQENPEAQLNDQDPGERQKETHNQKKDDPLAA